MGGSSGRPEDRRWARVVVLARGRTGAALRIGEPGMAGVVFAGSASTAISVFAVEAITVDAAWCDLCISMRS